MSEGKLVWTFIGNDDKTVVGTTNGCLVFLEGLNLPAGIEVRLLLLSLGDDQRGLPLYQVSFPDDPIYVEKLEMLPDGRIGLACYSRDWRGNEDFEGYRNIYKPEIRPGNPTMNETERIQWGITPDKLTFIILGTEWLIPQQIDRVEDGRIVSAVVGFNHEPISRVKYRLQSYECISSGSIPLNPDDLTNRSIMFHVSYHDGSGWKTKFVYVSWSTLPIWVKDELLDSYPICQCGKERYYKREASVCGSCALDEQIKRHLKLQHAVASRKEEKEQA